MRYVFQSILFCFLFTSLPVSLTASAAPNCEESSKDVPVGTKDASASAWGNLRNNPGSIRYESAILLQNALKDFSKLEPPADLCSAGCGTPKPKIVFTSIPKKFRTDYSDKSKCDALALQTKSKPFRYTGKAFDSEASFNDWFSDFSQGKGDDGSNLYAKCDGDCSPQYTTTLVPDAGKLRVDSDVLCGPARDKGDNQYTLTFAYRWSCK